MTDSNSYESSQHILTAVGIVHAPLSLSTNFDYLNIADSIEEEIPSVQLSVENVKIDKSRVIQEEISIHDHEKSPSDDPVELCTLKTDGEEAPQQDLALLTHRKIKEPPGRV